MPISATCSCGKQIRTRDELAGKRIKCPVCGQSVLLPSSTNGQRPALMDGDPLNSGTTSPAATFPPSVAGSKVVVSAGDHPRTERRFGIRVVIGAAVLVIGLGIGTALGLSLFASASKTTKSEPFFADLHSAPRESMVPPPSPFSGPTPPPVEDPREAAAKVAQEHYLKGARALDANDLTTAIASFTEAIRLYPDFAGAYGWRGVCYYKKGDHDTALADLNSAVRINPKDPVARLCRAQVFFAEKKYSSVVSDCEVAVANDPSMLQAHFLKAEAHTYLRQYKEVVSEYTEVIRKKPEQAVAYALRAQAYYALGMSQATLNPAAGVPSWDKSIRDADEAMRLNSKMVLAYQVRGQAYFAKGESDRAIADCNETLQLDEKNMIAYRTRGRAFLDKNQPNEAFKDLDAALKLVRGDRESLLGRGIIYFNRGEFARTITDLSNCLDENATGQMIEADRLNVYFYRGCAFSRTRDYDRAIRDLTMSIGTDRSNNATAYLERSRAYAGKGDRRRAEADYKRALALDPNIGK